MTAEKQRNAVPTLCITGEMTIYRAVELKNILMGAIREGKTLELDLSGVTELDTAGLQLLMLAKKASQAASGDLHLTGRSNAALDVLELLNVGAFFGDELVIPQRAQDAARP